jgi:hypothetical protein
MDTTSRPLAPDESMVGEEDPGAAMEVAFSPAACAQPAAHDTPQAADPRPPMSPGDQAPPGTPGAGETVCPSCGGSGRLGGGTCPECEGTGKVTVGIGGA